MNGPQRNCLRENVVPSRQNRPANHTETNGDEFCWYAYLQHSEATFYFWVISQTDEEFPVALRSLQSSAILVLYYN